MLDVHIRPRYVFEDFKLSRSQDDVLRILLSADRWFTTWDIHLRLLHSNATADVVKVFVFHLKRKLKAALQEEDDPCIMSQHARGYTLTENTRARLLKMMQKEAA